MQYQEEYWRNLPHIVPKKGMFHVIFRVKNSIPYTKIETMKESYKNRKEIILSTSSPSIMQQIKELQAEYFNEFEHELHQSKLAPLIDHAKAKIVKESVLYFHGKRCKIYACSIMPNHVHILISNLTHHLTSLLKSIKGYSAYEINKLDGKTGSFWQNESYDHLIQDRNEMGDTIDYILHNPVKSGICNHYSDHEFTWCIL